MCRAGVSKKDSRTVCLIPFSWGALVPLALLLVLTSFCIGQDRDGQENAWEVPTKPFGCEANAARMDLLASLHKKQEDGAMFIIVGRLGNDEVSSSLIRRRLHNAWEYLVEHRDVPVGEIVLAEGAVVYGYGRLEFYVGGHLIGTLLVQRGRDFCVDCCETGSEYYPAKGRKKKPHRRDR
jgi:hypothetical protein